jgi:uncharacterized protein
MSKIRARAKQKIGWQAKSLTKGRKHADELFQQADSRRNQGDDVSAFKLFLAAARAGSKAALLNVGYAFDIGAGVRKNKAEALRWYMRAYRRGDASAASNIATIWRDRNEPRRALSWFRRAVKLGDESSHLAIGMYYLHEKNDLQGALGHLKKVCESDRVSEHEAEEAKRLLKEIQKRLAQS